MDVLDGLAVVAEDVDANDGLVELRVSGLNELVVDVLLVFERVEALEDKVEQGLEILGRGRGDEDVRVAFDCLRIKKKLVKTMVSNSEQIGL
jgi:hypothetical protein